jgi:Tol biopolymer transport system component
VSRPRLAIPLLLALLTVALACVAPAGAAIPAGPRLSFLSAEFTLRPGKLPDTPEPKFAARLVTFDQAGHDVVPLLGNSSVEGLGPRVAWSADGVEMAFVGKPINAESDDGQIYLARADGTGVHAVPGTEGANDPVLSADGTQLAFSLTRSRVEKFDPKHPKAAIKALKHNWSSTTVWIVAVAGGKPHRLTPWDKERFATPTSISPDGSTLAFTITRPGAKEAVDALDLATGKVRELEANSAEGTYSPDGSAIAFASYRDGRSASGFLGPEPAADLYVAAADGSGARRISNTPHAGESAPSWSPGGTRLAYRQSPSGSVSGVLNEAIVESNADGSCAEAIALPPARHKGWKTLIGAPAWVPGPGREPAPLSC